MIIDDENNQFDCVAIVTNNIDFVEIIKWNRYSYKKTVYLIPTTIFKNINEKEGRRHIGKALLRYCTNKKIYNKWDAE